MTIITGNAVVQINDKPQTRNKAIEVNTENAVAINSDQINVSVKKGIVPTLKGVGVGAVGAGITGLGAGAILKATGNMGGENMGGIFIVGMVLGGIAAGAVAGGITANTTDNKLKGALIGAATTGVISALALGASARNLPAAGIGLVVGGIAGAIGGFSGSLVAQKK